MSRPSILAPLDYLKRLLDRRYRGVHVDQSPPILLNASQLNAADILFCRGGKKHVPWQVISYGSSGTYVHVAIYIGRDQVVESTTAGVTKSSLSDLVTRYKYVAVTRCPGAKSNASVRASVVMFCRDHVSRKTKYDLVGATLSPIFELLDLMHQRFKQRPINFNWPRNKTRTFCSQFALDAFVPSGYIPETYYAMGARSPTALAEEACFELIGYLSTNPNLQPMLVDDLLWTGGG